MANKLHRLLNLESSAPLSLQIRQGMRFLSSAVKRDPLQSKGASDSSLSHSEKEKIEPKKEKRGDKKTREIGGPKGPEPTRYGDWERNGRCSDF